MKTFYNKILVLFVCTALILSFFIFFSNTVAFGDTISPIKILDLTGKRDLSGKGYYWDVSKKTLTLSNANLSAEIIIPSNGDIKFYLQGENQVTGNIYSKIKKESGKVIITGDGTGSLKINGEMNLTAPEGLYIKNCIFNINRTGVSSTWCLYLYGDLNISDNARVILSDGLGGVNNLNINHAYLKVNRSNPLAYAKVEHISIKNSGELHIVMERENDTSLCALLAKTIYADENSIVEVKTSSKFAIHELEKAEILSKNIFISSSEKAFGNLYNVLYSGSPKPSEEELNKRFILPTTIRNNYYCNCSFFDNSSESYYYNYNFDLFEKTGGTVPVKTIQYKSDSAIQNIEKTKAGIQLTSINLTSRKNATKSIKLNWKKSPGYRVDYYEVYRSTDKYSFPDTPIFTTQFGIKNYYTNTKDLSYGKTYYYKVRGVREIDGVAYYTKWSTKAWRKI